MGSATLPSITVLHSDYCTVCTIYCFLAFSSRHSGTFLVSIAMLDGVLYFGESHSSATSAAIAAPERDRATAGHCIAAQWSEYIAMLAIVLHALHDGISYTTWHSWHCTAKNSTVPKMARFHALHTTALGRCSCTAHALPYAALHGCRSYVHIVYLSGCADVRRRGRMEDTPLTCSSCSSASCRRPDCSHPSIVSTSRAGHSWRSRKALYTRARAPERLGRARMARRKAR